MIHPIIQELLRQRRIGSKDFFGRCRMRHLALARRAAAIRMSRAGLSRGTIARLMRKDKTTIAYYVNKEWRAKRKAIYLTNYHAQKVQEIRA